MANLFYNHGSFPQTGAPASSSIFRAEFEAVAAGFNKMPALTPASSVIQGATSALTASLPFVGFGSWTPTFTFATPGDLSIPSYSTRTGKYFRIGALVLAAFYIAFTPTWTTASGDAQVTGLPFAAISAGIGESYVGNGSYSGGSTHAVAVISTGGSSVSWWQIGSGLSASTLQANTNFPSGSGYVLQATIMYKTDAA